MLDALPEIPALNVEDIWKYIALTLLCNWSELELLTWLNIAEYTIHRLLILFFTSIAEFQMTACVSRQWTLENGVECTWCMIGKEKS